MTLGVSKGEVQIVATGGQCDRGFEGLVVAEVTRCRNIDDVECFARRSAETNFDLPASILSCGIRNAEVIGPR